MLATDMEITLRDLRGEREPLVRRLPSTRSYQVQTAQSVTQRDADWLRILTEMAAAVIDWRFDDENLDYALTLARQIMSEGRENRGLYSADGADLTFVVVRVPASELAPA